MGEHGCDDDERCGAQPNGRIIAHRNEHQIGAAVARHVTRAIHPYNEKADDRQSKQNIGIFSAPLGHDRNRVVKSHTDHANHDANQARKKDPSYKSPCIPHGTMGNAVGHLLPDACLLLVLLYLFVHFIHSVRPLSSDRPGCRDSPRRRSFPAYLVLSWYHIRL